LRVEVKIINSGKSDVLTYTRKLVSSLKNRTRPTRNLDPPCVNGKWLPDFIERLKASAWHQLYLPLLPFTHARSESINASYSSEEGVVAGHSRQFTPGVTHEPSWQSSLLKGQTNNQPGRWECIPYFILGALFATSI